jgi:hypothetical protein
MIDVLAGGAGIFSPFSLFVLEFDRIESVKAFDDLEVRRIFLVILIVVSPVVFSQFEVRINLPAKTEQTGC